MLNNFFNNLTIKKQNEVATSFVLMLGLLFSYVVTEMYEIGNNIFLCKIFMFLIIICSLLNFFLSVLLFNKNNNFFKKLLIKLFLTLSVMSLFIPIINYELKQELDKESKKQFNKNLQTILDISNENISENLSLTDKEKYQKNINLIKEKYKNLSLPLTGNDLNITENVLYELNVLKQISNSKNQEESIEKDTKEIIKNIKEK